MPATQAAADLRCGGQDVTETLDVDPAILRGVTAGLRSGAAGLQSGTPAPALSSTAGTLPGLASGAACLQLASALDLEARGLARDMTQFAERLDVAASAYETRDTQLASRLVFDPDSADHEAADLDHFRGGPAKLGGGTDMSSGDITAIDTANRDLLDSMERQYGRLPDGQVKSDRLADIAAIREALTVPDSHLLYLARPDSPSEMIPAATAIGDPFNADHVSVTVPGVTGATRHSIAGMTREAGDLRREARVIAAKVGESANISTIAWAGYQPPPGLATPDTPVDNLAHEGAPKLADFLRDVDNASHRPDQTLALFGHSYGSLLSGIALKDGASAVVDNAVMYGSPGFEATSPAKLGMPDDHFFVMTAHDDQIRPIGALAPLHGWGSDPNEVIPGSPDRYRFTHLETDDGWVTLAGEELHKTASHGHSGYPRDALQQMSGFNLATILLDRPDLAVREVPEE